MKIAWTRLALRDLEHAYNYIAADNPRAARKVLETIEQAIQALALHPHMGRAGRVGSTRELIIVATPFIISYHIRGKRIEIIAIIHTARRWPEE